MQILSELKGERYLSSTGGRRTHPAEMGFNTDLYRSAQRHSGCGNSGQKGHRSGGNLKEGQPNSQGVDVIPAERETEQVRNLA